MRATITVLMVVGALCAQAQALRRPGGLLSRRVGGPQTMSISSETVGEYTWTYRINGDAAEIFNRGSVAISPRPKGAITVPSTLGGKPVTSIGESAFKGCSWVKLVTIPDGVTSIGHYAFSGCSGLKNVTIPNSVTSIGWSAFSNCSGLTSVTIPNSVTSIGDFAFFGCRGLTSVHITDLAKWCSSSFGGRFHNYNLYLGGEKITDLVIPDGVASIGEAAFRDCSGLTSVTIPASVTNIGQYAFSYCCGLTAFSVDEANPKYKSVSKLLLTKDGKTLVYGVNGEVSVPNGVTEVVDYAFAGLRNLTNVTFGADVAYFGRRVFVDCRNLNKVVFKGNAPEAVPNDFYSDTPRGMVTYVEKDSIGWSGENSKVLPVLWCGRPIKHIGQEVQSNSKESSDQDAQIAIQGPIKNSILSGRRRRPNGTMQNKPTEEGLLEPALSLEEAVELAKKDDPRGYYQLAIVISQKQNWKDKSFDARGYIDLFLKKAVDAGYRNAQFLDVLLADNCLSGDVDSSSPILFRSRAQGINGLTSPGQLIERYAGFKRVWWHRKGSLSSKDDVKAILDRYQKLVIDGCYQATNAIALLEWRAKRAEEKAAEEAAKMAESDEMANLVRSVAELPVKEKRNVSAEFAKEAKAAGALYIKSTEEGTKDLSWSVDEKKPLYFEFYDANEGWTRLLKFSADGRLLSVSPAQ